MPRGSRPTQAALRRVACGRAVDTTPLGDGMERRRAGTGRESRRFPTARWGLFRMRRAPARATLASCARAAGRSGAGPVRRERVSLGPY